MNRLKKPNLPENYSGPKTEIVIQEPKSKNSIRTIPLHQALAQDLIVWRRVQEMDRMQTGADYCESGMLVTNPFGGYVEPRTFKDYYEQMLSMAGIRHHTFHALRHTFATRAMERGMDPKTLSMLLGHSSASFTLDTYTHVLDSHKREAMSLMDDLYSLGSQQNSVTYPVIVTMNTPEGNMFYMPDFPEISCSTTTLELGLQLVQEKLHEEVLTAVHLPTATNPAMLQVQPGQMVVQVAV